MMYRTRRYLLTDVATAEELAEKLTRHTWCLCQAFALDGPAGRLIFANDSTSPDGAQEYAVLCVDVDGTRRQIESLTVSWCTEARLLAYIQQLQAGTLGVPFRTITNVFEDHAAHGRCPACA